MNCLSNRSASALFPGGLLAVILAAVAVLLVSWNGAFPLGLVDLLATHLTVANAIFAAVFVILWQFLGGLFGLYDNRRGGLAATMCRALACSITMTFLVGLYLAASAPRPPLTRVLVLFMTCAMLCEVVRMLLEHVFDSDPQRVVIVGSDRLAAKAWRELRTRRGRELEFVGFVDHRSDADRLPDIATRYLGEVVALPRLVLELGIDDVILATPLCAAPEETHHLVALAGAMGARILCLKDVCGIRPGSITRDYEDAFFELGPAPRIKGVEQAVKRAFDAAVSTAGLVVGLPLLFVAAILGLAGGPRLAFQAETKFGFRRRQFRTYRLCSASHPSRLMMYLGQLPLMWNVLRGEMALVGPPPLSADDISRAEVAALAGRFNVRPGLTGGVNLEWTSGKWGSEPGSRYLAPSSFGTDLKTLVKAFRTVSQRTGVADTSAGAL